MIKAIVLISDGSEEIESVTPIDVLRRAGVTVDVASVTGLNIVGSRGIKIQADKLVCDVDFADYDCVVVPGGMPGARIISENALAVKGIKEALFGGKVVGAICASPAVVLGENNLLGGKSATCFPAPDFIKVLGDRYTGKDVEVDGNLVTANGPLSAMEFALKLCEVLKVQPKL
ncbi:MAG: DJ-1/PfpI family protein [Clostridiales bacterium]|nr:DJ-1/PfpI family protein [Clostridiales bacterium]